MTLRQHLLLHQLLKGKTARRAALDAGYSLNSVNHKLSTLLRSPKLEAAFQRHLLRLQEEADNTRKALVSTTRLLNSTELSDKQRLSAARLVATLSRLLSTRLTVCHQIDQVVDEKPTTLPEAVVFDMTPDYNQIAMQPAVNEGNNLYKVMVKVTEEATQKQDLNVLLDWVNEGAEVPITPGDVMRHQTLGIDLEPRKTFKQKISAMRRRPQTAHI